MALDRSRDAVELPAVAPSHQNVFNPQRRLGRLLGEQTKGRTAPPPVVLLLLPVKQDFTAAPIQRQT